MAENKNKTRAKSNNGKVKKDDGKAFILKRVIPLSGILLVIYLVIYLCFLPEKGLPCGSNLNKSDWLSFLGAYLSFAGAIIVSLVVFWHAIYVSKRDAKNSVEQRKKKVQPIFSVNILSLNGMVQGTAEAISLHGPYINKHENMLISIENVNEYPIKHVIVYDKYLCPLLKTGEAIKVQCAYAGTHDAEKHPNIIAVITEDVYEKNEEGLPAWFNICYEDVDGRDMYQTFELKTYEGTRYFSLSETSEA